MLGLYDCWSPQRGLFTIVKNKKPQFIQVSWFYQAKTGLGLNPRLIGSTETFTRSYQTSGVPQQSWGFTYVKLTN